MRAPYRTRSIAGVVLILGLLPIPSLLRASINEEPSVIYTVGELLPRIGQLFGRVARAADVLDAPVVLPRGLAVDSPEAAFTALIWSGLALDEHTEDVVVRGGYDQSEESRAEPRLLAVNVSRLSPSDPEAIAGGAVYLFGLAIEPPYKVSTTEEGIYLNGVRIFPAQPPNITQPPPTAAEGAFSSAFAAACAAYARDRNTLGEEGARRGLVDRLRSLPGIRDAAWGTEPDATGESVALTHDDGTTEYLDFDSSPGPEERPSPEEVKEDLEAHASSLRDGLNAGGTILAGTSYEIILRELDANALRRRFTEILAAAEPASMKLARLQVYTRCREAAADFVYRRSR